ncbi:MAG: amidase [Bryobacterales bacterium]|nr:amidase [Bryobacterales bacterium]
MADLGQDVFFLTITELNAGLRERKFSAVELARAFCDRLEKLGPRLNALSLPLRDKALAKARNVDDEIRRDRLRGPLQGVPCAVKDLLSVAISPTTWGARPYATQRFDFDATVIRKLDRAGAVLTGKLAMVELAGAGGYRYPSASLTGPGLNPWDLTRWSGGSSSGSGSAVAAGLTAFALGSETWGSILTPAAFCGVTGLRPTYGLVSRYGAMPLSWTMDKIGPMCRSAEDCGHVLQAISGGDSNDSTSAGKAFYYTPQFARKLSDLRVGFAPADFAEHAAAEARPAFQSALEVVRSLGARMVEVELPDLPYVQVAETVISAEGSAVFEPLIHSGQVEQLADSKQIAGLKAGLEIPACDYLRAMRIRAVIRNELRKLLADVDLLVSPSRFEVAPAVTARLDEPEPPSPAAKTRGLRPLGAAGNLAGLPALSLPCGLAGGLPVAIQIVGRPFNENNILALGVEFQRRTDWHRRRPPAL